MIREHFDYFVFCDDLGLNEYRDRERRGLSDALRILIEDALGGKKSRK